MRQETGRFAPSPTGFLHLGHACSALTAESDARNAGGRFLLRMEDLDPERCRPEFEARILADLAWLGIRWDGPVLRQSERRGAYREALARLGTMNLLYRCTCSRREIEAASQAPQEGDGRSRQSPYPGTCRPRTRRQAEATGEPGTPFALRLDMRAAIGVLGGARHVRELCFVNRSSAVALDPDDLVERHGDIVLARKDSAPSYHLAVTVDDAAQNVTRVVRGEDLLDSTSIHRLIQALLQLPTPAYHHHPLVRNEAGRRLSKRDGDACLAALRDSGVAAGDVREMLGLPVE